MLQPPRLRFPLQIATTTFTLVPTVIHRRKAPLDSAKVWHEGSMEDMRELLNEMRESFKSGLHKQILVRMDDEIAFGECSPILRAVFQFMMGRTPAQHRTEAARLRATKDADSLQLAEFHELFADMLE
jgi:hypothetical protein